MSTSQWVPNMDQCGHPACHDLWSWHLDQQKLTIIAWPGAYIQFPQITMSTTMQLQSCGSNDLSSISWQSWSSLLLYLEDCKWLFLFTCLVITVKDSCTYYHGIIATVRSFTSTMSNPHLSHTLPTMWGQECINSIAGCHAWTELSKNVTPFNHEQTLYAEFWPSL